MKRRFNKALRRQGSVSWSGAGSWCTTDRAGWRRRSPWPPWCRPPRPDPPSADPSPDQVTSSARKGKERERTVLESGCLLVSEFDLKIQSKLSNFNCQSKTRYQTKLEDYIKVSQNRIVFKNANIGKRECLVKEERLWTFFLPHFVWSAFQTKREFSRHSWKRKVQKGFSFPL